MVKTMGYSVEQGDRVRGRVQESKTFAFLRPSSSPSFGLLVYCLYNVSLTSPVSTPLPAVRSTSVRPMLTLQSYPRERQRESAHYGALRLLTRMDICMYRTSVDVRTFNFGVGCRFVTWHQFVAKLARGYRKNR